MALEGVKFLFFLCMGMDVLPTCVSVHQVLTVSKEAGRGNWRYITGGYELADFSKPVLLSAELWLYSFKRKLLSPKSSTSFMLYIFNHS